MEHEIQLWLDFAQQDFDVAKHLNQTYHPKPIEIICYHCQQAAEKATKALMLHCGISGGLPRSHDISFLMNQIKNQINIPEACYDAADNLTPFGVAVRYPSELHLEERHCEMALKDVECILKWVRSSIT